jgi:hypothetical protein
MKSLIIVALSLFTFNSFAQTQFDNFDEAKKHLEKSFEGVNIHKNGIIMIDFGTACSGRYLFNLRDVTLSQTVKKTASCGSEPTRSAVISFECNGHNCILDPSMLYFEQGKSGGIIYTDIQKGFELYNILVQIQEFL